MKFLRFCLLLLVPAVSVIRAQDEERRAPPIEIPDFSNLDEYIYEPKSTVVLSFRYLSGPKAQFFGTGVSTIPSPYATPARTGANVERFYNDGAVFPDQRAAPVLDTSGNPMTDPQTGNQILVPIAPDGRTNSWTYTDLRQLQPNGFISFHSFGARVNDTALRNGSTASTAGLDLAMSRDMGKLFGGRVAWNLVVGMSVNDISGKRRDTVAANLDTITDLYSLYGQAPPEPPFTSPGSTSTSGSTEVLISSEPDARIETTTASTDAVTNNWKVKGAYFTFRGGSELWIPFTSKFRAGVSLGAALIYAGTDYTVTQTYLPDVGPEIIVSETSSVYKLRPGYYADASLQYDVTDKTGFFAGAVFQSAGSYTQTLNTANSQYATKIDLSNQSGVRAGMSIRF